MSSNYSAGQFEHAYKPKRLLNWTNPSLLKPNYRPSRKIQDSPTKIIVNERGHLLPHIVRNYCSSPWGQLEEEMRIQQSQQQKSKKITDDSKIILPTFYKRRRYQTSIPIHEDPILNKLKELQLPVIWVVGPQSQNVLKIRQNYCRQLAHNLSYAYINLDDKVSVWRQRYEEWRRINELRKLTEENLKKLKAKKSTSQLSQASTKNFQNRTQARQRTKTAKYNNENFESTSTLEELMEKFNKYKELEGEMPTELRNTLNISDNDSSEKILQFLKFAMIEEMPTRGFIIDGLPCDYGDAIAFEHNFYPATLGICFSEGSAKTNNPTKKTIDKRQNKRLPIQRKQINKPITKSLSFESEMTAKPRRCEAKDEKLKVVGSRYLRRSSTFSIQDANQICQLFGTKMIRVINSEEVDPVITKFLNQLVIDHLEASEAKSSTHLILREESAQSEENKPTTVVSSQKSQSDTTIVGFSPPSSVKLSSIIPSKSHSHCSIQTAFSSHSIPIQSSYIAKNRKLSPSVSKCSVITQTDDEMPQLELSETNNVIVDSSLGDAAVVIRATHEQKNKQHIPSAAGDSNFNQEKVSNTEDTPEEALDNFTDNELLAFYDAYSIPAQKSDSQCTIPDETEAKAQKVEKNYEDDFEIDDIIDETEEKPQEELIIDEEIEEEIESIVDETEINNI